MLSATIRSLGFFLLILGGTAFAQNPPYDVFPDAEPPYYRVRYEASAKPGALSFPVKYTVWVPPGVSTLRGVIVHQHGCGEGSCKSGLTGAFDLHWQALAQKHGCALLAPSYEQPEGAECRLWCDPREGSGPSFQQSLVDLGKASGHPELAQVPWALWGHSGGGYWAGTTTLLHPERVAAAWLRSGSPPLASLPDRPVADPIKVPDAALKVPIMTNLGTEEGCSVKDGRFSHVWPAAEYLFNAVRSRGGLIGVAIDPQTGHECGNQRYLAIPWFDACLSERLPQRNGEPLREMAVEKGWLAPLHGKEAFAYARFSGNKTQAMWLPNEAVAKAWMQYVDDTDVRDTTLPPAPTNLRVTGQELTWDANADLESGIAHFIIERDGKEIGKVPENAKNSYGRPIFQGLQFSDTPSNPLVEMHFTDTQAESGRTYKYRVITVNTVGLKSE